MALRRGRFDSARVHHFAKGPWLERGKGICFASRHVEGSTPFGSTISASRLSSEVEQLFRKQQVAGSSPAAGSTSAGVAQRQSRTMVRSRSGSRNSPPAPFRRRPHRLSARTPGFHPGKGGPTPPEAATTKSVRRSFKAGVSPGLRFFQARILCPWR